MAVSLTVEVVHRFYSKAGAMGAKMVHLASMIKNMIKNMIKTGFGVEGNAAVGTFSIVLNGSIESEAFK